MKQLLCIFVLVLSPIVFAKKFSTSYVSFDLLNYWKCSPVKNTWTCVSKLNRKKFSEATIILTAKQKGAVDSVSHYMKYLQTSKSIKTSTGGSFQSKINHVKQRQINHHTWVDGFHTGSEVPNYYTRYLVTVKGGLAILVTYSADKKHYTKYASDFAKSINSLRVNSFLNTGGGRGISTRVVPGGGLPPAGSGLGGGLGTAADSDFSDGEAYSKGIIGSILGGNLKFLGLIVLIICIIIYFLLKKKKQSRKRTSSRSGSSRSGSSRSSRSRHSSRSSRHSSRR